MTELPGMLDIVKNERTAARRLRAKGDIWALDGVYHPKSGVSYDHRFRELLGRVETFNDLVRRRKETGKSTFILDVFGSGVFITDYEPVDGIIGARVLDVGRKVKSPEAGVHNVLVENHILTREELEDYLEHAASPEVVAQDEEKRTVIEADLYDPRTRKQIKQEMARREIPHFDLIVCKPAGEFSGKGKKLTLQEKADYQNVFFLMLRRAYNFLSDDEGLMFIQIPQGIHEPAQIEAWVEQINDADIGISVKHHNGKVMKITKHKGAIDILPALQQQSP